MTINYRTSHQIRVSADRLLPATIADVDGNLEQRRGTVSVFDGPAPTIEICDDSETEIGSVGEWIANRLTSGMQPVELDGQIVPSQGCIAVSLHNQFPEYFLDEAVKVCQQDASKPDKLVVKHFKDHRKDYRVYSD